MVGLFLSVMLMSVYEFKIFCFFRVKFLLGKYAAVKELLQFQQLFGLAFALSGVAGRRLLLWLLCFVLLWLLWRGVLLLLVILRIRRNSVVVFVVKCLLVLAKQHNAFDESD